MDLKKTDKAFVDLGILLLIYPFLSII